MSNYNTIIDIQSLDDVYNFRAKVFDVVDVLKVERTESSRISCGLASYLRRVLVANQERFTIETEVTIENKMVVLRLRLPSTIDYGVLLDDFFEVTPANGGRTVILEKHFTLQNAPADLLDEITEILSQKTKEELLKEVEAKNIELQQSIEDLARTTQAKSRMENELSVAKDIQLSMLPLKFPAFPNRKDIDIYAHLIPAREVGGDFYDFFFLDEDHLGLVVGDVSGKGVPAALMMAVCKTLLKSRASSDLSTASIVSHVNNEMAKDNHNYVFITVFMAILNTKTGVMTYTNAGHNPTYIRKSDQSLVKLSQLHGPVVAAMEGMTYKEDKVQLSQGDIIFGYTDGIPEAHNSEGELFTDARLQDFLSSYEFDNAESMVQNIIKETQAFEAGCEQFDDVTALCVHFKADLSHLDIVTKQILIRNQIAQVRVAIETFEEFAMANEIPMPAMMKINIVFDELLSNIVKYGFSKEEDGNHEIQIKIEYGNNRLIITFIDTGVPFNPFQKTPPDVSLPLEQREIGGLGVHLVRKLMDEFSYKRTGDSNIVTMIKNNV